MTAAASSLPRDIRKVGVLGSGVMGAGIAAHCANAGVPVVLLDIVPKDLAPGGDRSAVARGALERAKRQKPAPFLSAARAALVTPGNLEDDLGLLADCDWIVEAVLERLDVKHDVYRKVDAVRKPGSIVSSNTSTIPLAQLVDGLPESFARDFAITHFFNPPRYMRLLELVAGPQSDPGAIATLRAFCDVRLGKSVVDSNDTPAFLANRVGTYWIAAATNAAEDLGLTVEEADAVAGRAFGFPKTGIFGLLDLVGIDLGPHVAASLLASLPKDDGYRAIHRESPLVAKMIATGLTGRKGKGGYYRMEKGEDGARRLLAIDLATGEYRPAIEKPRLASLEAAKKGGPAALLEHPDRGGKFARRMILGTLAYAASLLPEITDRISSVDEAMRAGFGWEFGPFELIDRIGAPRLAAMLEADGVAVPPLLAAARANGGFYRVESGRLQELGVDGAYSDVPRPDGVLLLADVRRASKPVAKNGSAQLWDLGDGVLCLEFRSKMNSLDDAIVAMLESARERIEANGSPWRALVIANDAPNFSVGANLGVALFAANLAMWPAIEASMVAGQEAFRRLKYAPFPSVGAPAGMALGGGCEILLHCSALQAHVESYLGLVEAGVGLVPGWNGIGELVERFATAKKRPGGPMPPVAGAFEILSTAKVSTSSDEAREMRILRDSDGVTMNRDRLLADAKAKALALVAAGYAPPEPFDFVLPGPTGRAALSLAVADFVASGAATPHDAVVAGALATAITGGDTDPTETVSEEEMSRLARVAFLGLVKTPGTLARIEHMLETGKPLRN